MRLTNYHSYAGHIVVGICIAISIVGFMRGGDTALGLLLLLLGFVGYKYFAVVISLGSRR